MQERPSSQPPRKMVLATVMKHFTGTMDARLSMAEQVIDDAAARAKAKYGRIDLIVLPEHAIQTEHRGPQVPAEDKAVPLEGPVTDRMAARAKQHGTYLVLPILRREASGRLTNIAAVLDRQGTIIGIYEKLHPVGCRESAVLEHGITPGREATVFECDFGRMGAQICWDMSYDDGFDELGRRGVNLVVIPSASPQTVAPAAHAKRNGYWVVTSTPRDNATVFNPAGQIAAQTTAEPVLVAEIDLSYAVLHWQHGLRDGAALTAKFGDRVGYQYSAREDTGVFWSNDPATPIGRMIAELGLREMSDHVEADLRLRDQLLKD